MVRHDGVRNICEAVLPQSAQELIGGRPRELSIEKERKALKGRSRQEIRETANVVVSRQTMGMSGHGLFAAMPAPNR